MNSRSQLRGGMQVHAVPEAERAFDSSGQRLPWGYEYADPDRGSRISSQEKGPFGRSTRRRTPSRSKTGTPSRKEDKDSAENWRVIDDIFTRAKESEQNKESLRTSTQGAALATPSNAETNVPLQATPAGQPSEVILYGFPPAFQYAAIEFYERVSQGTILEEYDRYPPHTKYDLSLSLRSSRGATRLSKEALLKKNHYHGGDHWIKVTFDSAAAAERACYYSPHVVKGYLIYAERYRGMGPAKDEAILATDQAIESATASPSQRSSSTMQQQQATSSETATSATATETGTLPDPFVSSIEPHHSRSYLASSLAPPTQSPSSPVSGGGTSTALQSPQDRKIRIRGARRTTLLPAEKALLPASSRWQRLLGALPLVGLFVAGSSDSLGDQIPRDQAGNFDSSKASLYWKFFYWCDAYLNTDFCGLKGDE